MRCFRFQTGCLSSKTTEFQLLTLLKKVGKILKEKNSKTFLSMPAPMQIWQAVTENDNTDCPVTVPSGKKWLSEYAQKVIKCMSSRPKTFRNILIKKQ